MDKITTQSPKRLIVVDAIDALAQDMFGDKYDYHITTTQHDPLEKVYKLEKPRWTSILGDESTELDNFGGSLANDVLVNVLVTANVPSNHLAHAMPYLEDIETMKRTLIGNQIDHKGHSITCNTQNEDLPAFSATHDIDYSGGGGVLRILFAIVLRIYDEP